MTTHPILSFIRRREFKNPLAIFIAAALACVPAVAKDPPKDAACEVPTLVSTGGPAPRNPHTLAIRWTGYSNFELAYGGQIMLLDAYFDRGTPHHSCSPLSQTPARPGCGYSLHPRGFSARAQIPPTPDARKNSSAHPADHQIIVRQRFGFQHHLLARQFNIHHLVQKHRGIPWDERMDRMGCAISGAESPAVATW